MHKTYKYQNSLKDRVNQAYRLQTTYPNHVPVICEKMPYAPANCPQVQKKTFLVAKDARVMDFIGLLRGKLHLQAHESLFLLVNDTIPRPAETFANLYHHGRDEDGLLYVNYTFENTFGAENLRFITECR